MSRQRSKWQRYTERLGMQIGDFLNRTMRRALKAGVEALVANTVHDSSRAASHWVVIPNRGPVSPGGWREMTFNPAFGRPPVGRPGDKGANAGEATRAVTDREMSRSIDKAVAGRQPASRFLFSNATPVAYDDRTGGFERSTERLTEKGTKKGTSGLRSPGYATNAKLEAARDAAVVRMGVVFSAALARGDVRKRPLR